MTTGQRATVGMAERLYRLGSLCPPTAVEGSYRAATEADAGLLDAWLTDFQREALVNAPRPRLQPGSTVLWTIDNVPVSMAAVRQPVHDVSRIGPVYTPVDRRGHGYASAVTAAAAEQAHCVGAVEVVLFTDLANPVSNSIYQRIGFDPISDWLRVDFAAAS
jgi:predicted GNAT family acetyltransferase